MSGMAKGYSLLVANASAPLTVPVAVVLVHRGSAQGQEPQLRRVRRDAGLSQLRDSSGYKVLELQLPWLLEILNPNPKES